METGWFSGCFRILFSPKLYDREKAPASRCAEISAGASIKDLLMFHDLLFTADKSFTSVARIVISWKTQHQTHVLTNILLVKVSLIKTLDHIQSLSVVLWLSLTSDLHL